MIGETSAFNSTISTDRTYSGGVADSSSRQDEDRNVSQQNSTTDTVTLSAESVSLAENVAPVAESTETLVAADSTSEQQTQNPDQQGTIINTFV